MVMKVNTEMENVEYRSGWKPVTREGTDQISVIAIPGKPLLNTALNHKNQNNNDHSKNDSKVAAQNSDISTVLSVLSKLESYKEEINQKLDNISTELNTLITLILEASAQEPDKKPKGIRKLFRRNPDIK